MSTRTVRFVAICGVILSSLPVSFPQAQISGSASDAPISTQRTVLAGEAAYAMLPPELIAGPKIDRITASSDMRYLLLTRIVAQVPTEKLDTLVSTKAPPSGQISLILWDSRSRASTEVWRGKSPDINFEQIEWLPGSSTVFILVRQTMPHAPDAAQGEIVSHQFFLAVHAGVPSAQAVQQVDLEDKNYEMTVSPRSAMAFFSTFEEVPNQGDAKNLVRPKWIAYLADKEGSPWKPITTGEKLIDSINWGDQGQPLVSLREKGADFRVRGQWHEFNPQSGELLPSPSPPKEVDTADRAKIETATESNAGLKIVRANAVLKKEETVRDLKGLWLEGNVKSVSPRALICGDCTDGAFIPGGQVIVYRSQGALWATPLVKMNHEQHMAVAFAEQRQVAIQTAKQIGTALIQCAQDWNERYPPPAELAKLTPYLKNPDDLKDFNYTYPGGPLAAIENPSQTELGAIVVPGGRAVVYADGHVHWRTPEDK